jgi:DNA-binding FadR family transcriptional regulator
MDVTARLRGLVLDRPNDTFLGNEDMLERELGVSKPTIRQAARVLEREGLLRVRRGNNGGYFGTRPDAAFIEATVASYLEVLQARPQDLTLVATALWIETVRRASGLDPAVTGALAAKFRRAVARMPEQAGFSEIQMLEHKIRRAVFDLVRAPYVELIFNINANFVRRQFDDPPSERDDTELHREFVKDWRRAATLQLDAIALGDAEIAERAARHVRTIIYRRIWPADAAGARNTR